VSPENDLLYPADGMRRLLAMEKTNGIWTQKMLMRLERKLVNIMDYENKEVVEQFPIGLVREPTAFTSNDPKEMYNNILIFIVGRPPMESPLPSEMHIFQCVNVRSRDVVEDLKAFMSGRARSGASHEIDVGDLSPYDAAGEPTRMQAQLSAHLEAGGRRNDGSNFDETSSTSSDKYERDVTILNRCFDDIEKFIARLQHAAAAFRELEKRRRSRKSKKKDLGDGMLSMRAKPPPEREFVDIFQKFKLSFNLLAKLKAHIHDPNAPELVHFLFTPLALIVDASHDSHYGPNLPAKVVSPLLTGSAVELLINCLTSKESELWHSLGEPWYVPAEEWKGYVGPYRPVFMDGWSPAVSYSDVVDHPGRRDRKDADLRYGYGASAAGDALAPTDSDTDTAQQRHSPPRRERGGGGFSARRGSGDSSERNGHGHGAMTPLEESRLRFENQQRSWMLDLQARGAKVVQVIITIHHALPIVCSMLSVNCVH
jgi:epidermal growth factor receptor kinase substrate 8